LRPDETACIFVPGKNWRLSLAELMTFLRARKVNFKIADFSKSFFIVASEGTLDPKLIDGLGGTIKVGKILSQISSATVEDAFLNKEEQALFDIRNCLLSDRVFDNLFDKHLTRRLFGVSVYFENPSFFRFSKKVQRFVGSCLKDELASRGVRARFMGFREDRRLPQLTHVEVLKKALTGDGAEVLFCIGRTETFVSKTLSVHDPFEFQKRDVGRLIQRRIYSIPPRLARIMVNLSMCLPEKTLLDPFCGVGTILQEALLLNARVTGIDIDPWCVKASHANLGWLRDEYDLEEARYTVLLGDSRNLMGKIGKETVDCIVTEPDLGPPLRHSPTESYAKRITTKLRPLYCSFLEGAYEALRPAGNLVFVTPYVKTRSGRFITLNLEEEAKKIGFRKTYPFEKKVFAHSHLRIEEMATISSFVEIGKRHKIGREINILQK
jgi:tRNA G10  N-methylase Trm11